MKNIILKIDQKISELVEGIKVDNQEETIVVYCNKDEFFNAKADTAAYLLLKSINPLHQNSFNVFGAEKSSREICFNYVLYFKCDYIVLLHQIMEQILEWETEIEIETEDKIVRRFYFSIDNIKTKEKTSKVYISLTLIPIDE